MKALRFLFQPRFAVFAAWLWTLSGEAILSRGAEPAPAAAESGSVFSIVPDDFSIRATDVGFMREDAFLEFLSKAGAVEPESRAARGFAATFLVILLGGLALNLTPCVLPMIPVNLAIIGAGSGAATRRRGFVLGGLYGMGIAVAYGALGVLAALTGARFGALNASPVFNLALAVLFAVLALALFDVIPIDLSRFQPAAGGKTGKTGLLVVLGMGALSALLAGACVAPVVIAVLVLSSTQVAAGNPAGVLWPFFLGVGMALPWPFLGAGLARLPRPGAWMNRIKIVFGVFILLLAAYHGKLAGRIWTGGGAQAGEADFHLGGPDDRADWPEVWAKARKEGKPVFVDFWATWCKTCAVMERTTFQRPAVRQRLADFIVVKFQTERMDGAAIEQFNVRGLPTYAILVPP